MKIGITGTQVGLNDKQKRRLAEFASGYHYIFDSELNHGDCIGADVEVATFFRNHFPKLKIVCHPPDNDSKRAFFESDESKKPLPYLVRSHNIVDASDLLLAFPKTDKEELRSGTWATTRYAKKKTKDILIFWPSGKLTKPQT